MPLGNLTMTTEQPQWHNKGMWRLPSWGEPLLVASILFIAMYLTRRKNFKIWGWRKDYRTAILDDPDMARSAENLLAQDTANDDQAEDLLATSEHPSKKRRVLGLTIPTPNTSRFSRNIHSRLLQKFPFLTEMFYWVITFLLYRIARVTSQIIFSKTGIWDVSQEHGLRILEFEQFGSGSFLFPIHEQDVQQWFIKGHQMALAGLNQTYALIHIPGTVVFIAWYYYVAPNHSTFATLRRTLTLTNHLAFLIFTVYPCMPPRLLPEEYGFVDTVRTANAESVFMSGKYVNSLAAMPSMHFGYAFEVGCTMLYHSGIFRKTLHPGEVRKNIFWKLWYLIIGVGYPIMILVTIVATANHYWMDIVVALFVTFLAFSCNKVYLVLLPMEDLLLWALRLEKPTPSTGERYRERGGNL